MPGIVRWVWRSALSIAAIGVLGWAPVFDWMAPDRVGRSAPGSRTATAAVRPPDARLVLLISIDGLAPRVLATTSTPLLDRLAREGVAASDARTVVPSITMTSHTSMLSGVMPQVHGVYFNRYQPWSRIDTPTVFTECKRARLRCGLFAGKRKFAHFAELEPGVERYAWGDGSGQVLEQTLDFVREVSPDFALIHLAEVDLSGHDEGWGSDAQRLRLREIDESLRMFLIELTGITERPVALIVTADHGGHEKSHGTEDLRDVQIPWIAWGDGVVPGGELVSVGIADTAPTVLSLLGLGVPADWSGRARL